MIPNILRHICHFESFLEIRYLITVLYQITFLKAIDSILHARLRNNCSDLNEDLYLNHLQSDGICACGNNNESALHFFLECERFNDQRILMFRETRLFHPLSVNYLLFGKPNISNEENFLLFQAFQRYIKNTKRFT